MKETKILLEYMGHITCVQIFQKFTATSKL